MNSGRNIVLAVLFFSLCYSQSSLTRNQKIKNSLGFSSGIYANYGSSNLEVDGFVRIENNTGMFVESSSVFNYSDGYTIYSSIGFLKKLSLSSMFGVGFSNYFDQDGTLNELFIGSSISYLTTFIFFDLSNFQKTDAMMILDVNHFIPKISYDIFLIGTSSQELNKIGGDLFINFSKLTKNRISYGCILSLERFESQRLEKKAFQKNGVEYEKFFPYPNVQYGFYNNFYIGFNFF